MIGSLLCLFVMLWTGLAHALPAGAGAEVVVVVDTSCSMATASNVNGQKTPPNDPERLAVLGAEVVQALGAGPRDDVTVIGFAGGAALPPPWTRDSPDIRSWPYGGTWFEKPMRRAQEVLAASKHDTRLLIVLTDGLPNDQQLTTVEGLHQLWDPAAHPEVDILALGLFGNDEIAPFGSTFLGAMVHDPEQDFHRVKDATEVVDAFTRGYARAVGSRPITGQLAPKASRTISVGRYVSEILAFAVSQQPGPAFDAKLSGPTASELLGKGDNDCKGAAAQGVPGKVCGGLRRHFQVFRAENDPAKASEWTLSLPEGSGSVGYGIILRYDLVAELEIPPEASAGMPTAVTARLLFQGKTFDDADFFAQDHFAVTARIEGDEVSLVHAGSGLFTGTWTPRELGTVKRAAQAEVLFKNDWMEKRDTAQVAVGPPLYELSVQPSPLLLGPVPSHWSKSTMCDNLDLSGSKGLDGIELSCVVKGVPMSVPTTCTRLSTETLEVCANTRRWCCGQERELEVTVSGPGVATPRTSVTVPVKLSVASPGFLRCHWLAISLTIAAIVGAWFLYGWIRPHSFDPSMTITIAGDERGLKRAAPQALRECPGGKRGFYRNARICISSGGDLLRAPRGAAVVLEAGKGGMIRFKRAGGLEQLERRTRKWKVIPPEDLAQGAVQAVIYKLGDLHLRVD